MDTDNDVPIPMLSKEHFAEAILDRMVQTGETLPLRYEPQGFRLASSDGHVFNLGNAYGEFSAAPPSKRAKILSHYVRGWLLRCNNDRVATGMERCGSMSDQLQN